MNEFESDWISLSQSFVEWWAESKWAEFKKAVFKVAESKMAVAKNPNEFE